MKLRIFASTILLAFSFIQSAKSQTIFALDSASLWTYGNCPGDSTFIHADIIVSGYNNLDTVKLIADMGDGTVYQTYRLIYNWGSPPSNWCWLGTIDHIYSTPGVYHPKLIGIAPDLKTDTVYFTDSIVMYPCGNISGDLYADLNTNCTRNFGEPSFYWSTVKLTNNTTNQVYYANTSFNGRYDANVPVGATYTVEPGNPTLSYCPTSINASVGSSNNDFGWQCLGGFDFTGMIYGAGFRPGFARGFTAKPFNKRCMSEDGTMKIVLSHPAISYTSISWWGNYYRLPDQVIGDTLIWNFSNLDFFGRYNTGNQYKFKFGVATDTTVNVGDTICLDMIIIPKSGDQDPSDNVKQFCFPVSNSFDPNNKLGLPLGYGPERIIDRGQAIDYTINFQNTGNDTAYKVVLVDTIAEELDLATIDVQGASHPFRFEVDDDRVVKFIFEDIDLPDSTTNEPESHGQVNFSISQVPNLPYGTYIENKAGIYFDFNPPIITNTEVHKVDIISGVETMVKQDIAFSVYPNPTEGRLVVKLSNLEMANMRIFNITGKVMNEMQLRSPKTELDLSEYNSGIYLVELTSGNKRTVQKITIR